MGENYVIQVNKIKSSLLLIFFFRSYDLETQTLVVDKGVTLEKIDVVLQNVKLNKAEDRITFECFNYATEY